MSCLLSDELKSRVGGLKSRLDEVNKEKYVNSHYKNALQKAPFDSFESIKCVCVCVCAQPAWQSLLDQKERYTFQFNFKIA